MIFTAIPYSFASAAENPVTAISIPAELTLFFDDYHEEDSTVLTAELTGENGADVTNAGEIVWRTLNPSVAAIETDTDDNTKITVKAKGTGSTNVVATVQNTDGESFSAVCKVTVRESFRVSYEAFKVIMNMLQTDVDDVPAKYTTTSLALLRELFSEIQSNFNELEVNKPFLEWKTDLLTFVQDMEDTQDNCILVNNWKTRLMTIITTISNSRLAMSDNTEFWQAWDEAFSLMPDDLSLFTENSAKAVTDVIDEYNRTVWLDNEEYLQKINALAASLTEAIENLKKHTTFISIDKASIPAEYGRGTFKIPYTIVGDDPITWYSSDSEIVSVDRNGFATVHKAIPEGYNKDIRIFAESNNKIASCVIVVLNPISEIVVPANLAVLMDDPKQLVVDIIGVDKTAPVTDSTELIFECDNTDIAVVSQSGIISGVSQGRCNIKVSVRGNEIVESKTCSVSVSPALKVQRLVPSGLPSHVTVNAVAEAKIYVHPKTATNKEIKWTSSDESIATVTAVTTDENSYATAAIKGIRSGSVLITYETTDGSNIRGTFDLTVDPLIYRITFDKNDIKTYIGSEEKLQIEATCYPANAGNQKLSWIVDDENVATVVDGKITLKATGTCTITAVAQDGSGISKSTTLTVLGSAQSIEMSNAPSKMNTGDKLDLDCTVITKQGVSYSVRDWSVDDETLAKVDRDGVVTALLPGKVKVTATYFDGTSASKTINIVAPLYGISLPSSLTLSIGKTKTLSPTFNPSYATNKNVTWITSDSKVASVSTKGVISAAGIGTAIITAKSEEGGYIATCKVYVIQPVTGVTLNKDSYYLTMGVKESVKLAATVAPTNASTKTVTWKSSNTKVANVSSTGVVSAVGPGTAKITVTTLDGSFTAECKITVRQPVKGIKFSSSKFTYYVGQKKTASIVFTPANASNKGVTYKCSDTSVATISDKGVVTAKKKGTATLTAVSDDGKFKATATLKVVKKVDVDDIDITKTSVKINAGKTKQLYYDVYPGDASVKDVTWTTSDKTIASVNSNGVVTAHKGGVVVIKCTSKDTGVSDKCKVTVIEKVKSISISAKSLTLVAGQAKTLIAEISPETATNQGITWYSTNKAVATVNSNGKVTAVKGGTCNIAAKSKDDPNIIVKCKLVVVQPPTKITLSETELSLTRGDKAALSATVKPKDSFDKSVTWKSSDSTVARVNSEGIVTAVTAGTAVITCASTVDPTVRRTCNVTVFQPVTGIKLSFDKITMTAGRTKTLIPEVLPEKASNKKVTFKTSNKDVARVSSKGVIEAIGPGQATITVRTEDGFYTAKCTVYVVEPVVGISLDKKSTSIALGRSKTLTATLRPKNATNQDVVWRSSNPLVARVTQSGTVTALAEGTAIITCTTVEGGFKASCKVSCIIPVEAVTLKYTELTMAKGTTKTMKANIYPEYASNQQVTWKSSDTSVATIDSNGKITAVGKGVCIITCTTKQGGKKATCILTVKKSS